MSDLDQFKDVGFVCVQQFDIYKMIGPWLAKFVDYSRAECAVETRWMMWSPQSERSVVGPELTGSCSGIKPAETSSVSGLTGGNYSLLLQLTNDRARLCLCQCVSSSQAEAKWFKLQCRDRQTLRSEFQTSVRSILDPNLGIQNMKWFAYWTVSVNVSGAGWYLIILYQMLDRILDTDSPIIIYLNNICWSIIHILCHI